jgi:PadR family transcriptional regulator PadR
MSRPSDLVQGTLDALILGILSQESLHGLAIAQRIRERSEDILRMSPGSLYPALHKLEHEGYVRADWRKVGTGRRGKYYAITARGKRRLEKETVDWQRLSKAISTVLKPA